MLFYMMIMLAIFAAGWVVIWSVDKIRQINEEMTKEQDEDEHGWW